MFNTDNKNTEFDLMSFGEVMLRLSPVSKERISQSEVFEKKAGGAELNVAAGVSQLGLRTGIITKLPDNEIGKFIKNQIRYTGVSDDYIIYDTGEDKRLGIYYYESGAYPRLPTVVYDRHKSSFTTIKDAELSNNLYSATRCFHVSGISLAVEKSVRSVVIEMIKRFKQNGAVVSFDVNYRASLWDETTARETIEQILPFIDILFISGETLRRMFGQTGEIEDIIKAFSKRHNNIKVIASTMRTVVTHEKHDWSSIMYSAAADSFYTEQPYEGIQVVDRIGSGDAYVAGALFGLIKYNDIKKAVEYGNAMAALKNTVPGDIAVCDFNEIERVITNHQKGQASEMVR